MKTAKTQPNIRLQKLLADAGVASRRHAEEMIQAGRVQVDGVVVTKMGHKTAPDADILVDGKPINAARNKVYIMLNKPRGVITSASDELGRKTVLDLLTPQNNHGKSASFDITQFRLFAVGRLDYNTSGLI